MVRSERSSSARTLARSLLSFEAEFEPTPPMKSQGFMFNAVVYVSGYTFLVFVAVCLGALTVRSCPLICAVGSRASLSLARACARCVSRAPHLPSLHSVPLPTSACGLYYLAELVEEHTSMMRRIMYGTTVAVIVTHILFLVEMVPPLALATGALAHVSYLWLLNDFPFIRFLSTPFLVSLALLVASHYLWISHFLSHYHSLTHVLCFCLFMMWLVPFGFFISLSVNESTLPNSHGSQNSGLLSGLGFGKRNDGAKRGV
jgi:hypothetical protein